MKKIGSVIKLDNNDIKLKIGTIDKKNPEVIYLEGGFYIKPIIQKENYKSDIEEIKSVFQDLVKDYISKTNDFKNDYMLFIDVADDWIMADKKSFLSFQVYLKPSNEILEQKQNFTKLVSYLEEENVYDTSFIKNVFESHGYSVYKTKR